MRIAVIGSNSFSGGDFIDLAIDEGHDVIGISRSDRDAKELFLPCLDFLFYQMNLNWDVPQIMELLDRFRPDYVVNFAAQSEVAPSWEYPEHWFQTNVVALVKLTNALKDRSYLKRYVHISTPEVYGTCEGSITESAPMNPSTPYAASKAAADMFLSTLVKNYNFPLITIRSANVYGARQQLWKIIPRTAIYLKLGKTIQLHGGGTAVRSFIHIRDISHGTWAAMWRGQPGKVYHLSPSHGCEVRDIVRKVCDITGYNFERFTESVGERQGHDAVYSIDSSRARSELGWFPRIELRKGLTEVIDWVWGNWKEIQQQPLEYIHRE